jgi:ATP-dependent DNA helicase RecQ
MESRRRPQLVGSLAERLAAIGRLPMLGRLDRRGGEGASRVNSAQRVRALYDAITVGPDLSRALGGLHGAPVLLVDDYADTGWTLALAARALRRAGAGPVLPFVLAVVGAR